MVRAIRDWIKAFFYFSTTEANGLCCLILLISLLMIAPKAFQVYYKVSVKEVDYSADLTLLETNLRLLQENARKAKRIDINTATVQQLTTIEGISPKLALTIIRYRNKLGGFVSLNQFKEIYGLPYRLQIKLKQQTKITTKYSPKQLLLNHASLQELVAHPYISFESAKAIIHYRKHHGKFSTPAALQNLPGYRSDWVKKIMPYCSLL